MMPTGLIVTGVFFFFWAAISATTFDSTPVATFIFGGVGILLFLSGFVLYIIERYKK